MPIVSVVIPAHNERDNIPELHRRLRALRLAGDIELQILIVDDGSTDDTAASTRRIADSDAHVILVSLDVNAGQQAAIAKGLQHASGDAVIVMDADLQTPPEYLPAMIARWRDGAPIVAMRRAHSSQPWPKRATSRLYYRSMQMLMRSRLLADVPDFYLLERDAVARLRTHAGAHRFHRGALPSLGLPVTQMDYEESPRFAGRPKYTWRKSIQLAIGGLWFLYDQRRGLSAKGTRLKQCHDGLASR